MNFTEQLVAMTIATMNADNKVEVEELETIRRIAADLELDAEEVEACITKEYAKPRDLASVAKSIRKKEDAKLILEACEQVALADKFLAREEVELLLSIAEMLKIQQTQVVIDLATLAQNDRSILIEGNTTLHGDDEIEMDEE